MKPNMMDPRDREALALRLARAALELADLRGVLRTAAVERYEGAGTTLAKTEAPALEALSLGADDVQRALWSLAERLDRDLGSKV